MKPTEDKQIEPYTPEEQEIIDGLKAAQEQLNASDVKFAKDYLKTYTEGTWNRLRRGQYEAKDRSKIFAEMRSSLASIRRRIARQLKATQGSKYYELDQFAAMFRAVSDCMEKKGENRLIFYVAPTGGGKSRFVTELSLREEVTAVLANEPWFGSYFYASIDILQQLEVKGNFQSGGDARKAMIETMKSQRARVLTIDEGNYFGPRSINLIKDILNQTEWVVWIGCTKEFWDKMQRHYAEWRQLQRRIHSVFFYSPLTSKQIIGFLQDAGLNGDAGKASIALADAANKFGAFDFIQRVIERLSEQERSDHPTLEDVTAAIAGVRKHLGLTE